MSSRRTHWLSRVEAMLDRSLPEIDDATTTLHRAMRYACLGGGKRLRATLVYAAGEMVGATDEALDYPASALEMMHAYSLIHDDLPAMDDDDLRRGKPTCHKAFGEAVAILAGDALQARAFELLSDEASGLTTDTRLTQVQLLSRSSGANGMAGGQLVDLEAVGQPLDLKSLKAMHEKKTGALIKASVMMGAVSCGPLDSELHRALDDYSDAIGLAFQVVDDILDETESSETLGKTGGADRAAGKPTYTSLLGIPKATEIAQNLHHKALASLGTIGHNTAQLEELANLIVNRRH